MACNHEQIMSVNCVLYCVKCGAELPKDFVPVKVAEAAETPENGGKTATKRTSRKKV